MLIDEAYMRNFQRNQEVIDMLCRLMDQYKCKFIVVAAVYEQEMKILMESNPGLSRRFTVRIHFDDYTPEEMRRILEIQAGKEGCVFSDDLLRFLPDFCENWVNSAGKNDGNAGEAVNLIEKMVRMWRLD